MACKLGIKPRVIHSKHHFILNFCFLNVCILNFSAPDVQTEHQSNCKSIAASITFTLFFSARHAKRTSSNWESIAAASPSPSSSQHMACELGIDMHSNYQQVPLHPTLSFAPDEQTGHQTATRHQ
jgi:hypothetical protein